MKKLLLPLAMVSGVLLVGCGSGVPGGSAPTPQAQVSATAAPLPQVCGDCSGSLGDFSVCLTEIAGDPEHNNLELTVLPKSFDPANAPAGIDITITNSSLAYKALKTQVAAAAGVSIDIAPLTRADRQAYDILALTPHQAGVSFAAAQNAKDALCYLPAFKDSDGDDDGD